MQFYMQIGWFYFYLGFMFGNWIARIPDVQVKNNLSNTMLGVVFLSGAVGAIMSLPVVSKLNEKIGSAHSVLIGTVLLAISSPSLGISKYHIITLIPTMLCVGFCMAIIDVSMTGQASLAEKRQNDSQMGLYGAVNALGNVAGVLFGGVLAYYGFSSFLHFCIVSAICMPLSVVCYCWLFSQKEENYLLYNSEDMSSSNASNITPFMTTDVSTDNSCAHSPLLSDSNSDIKSNSTGSEASSYISYLCVIGFLAQISIGIISEWSTVYFKDTLSASPFLCTIGFAFFSFAVAIGNYVSGYISMRYSRWFLIKTSGLISATGMFVVIAAVRLRCSVFVASSGMIIVGAAISCIQPIVASAAGDIPHIRPSDAIALINSVSYIGYLVGPPFIGAMSDLLHGLKFAFFLLWGLWR